MPKNRVKTDMQRSVSGHKKKVVVRDKIVITSMLLLSVMMNSTWRHTNISHVLVVKSVFEDKECVVQHVVDNTAFVLCLNCDSWIQYKYKVIAPGWSLFDYNGDRRQMSKKIRETGKIGIGQSILCLEKGEE